jgi:hypothetical protein
VLSSVQSCAARKQKGKSVEYKLTVGGVSPSREDQKYMEVVFLESARYYRISKKSKKSLALLSEAQKSQKPVMVKRANEYSDIIIGVRKPVE